MYSRNAAGAIFAAAILCGAVYLVFLYTLNRTDVSARLKRGGLYRCPQYQHEDFIFGSDYSKTLAAVIGKGVRAPWYREQFAKYGKTYETNIWGKRIFQTCDPINVQALLTAPSTQIGAGPSRAALVKWLGPGTFTVDGELWRRARDNLKPVFRKTAVSDMTRLDKHLDRLMDELNREDLKVDLQDHLIRMFLDFFMELLIGEDIKTVNKDFSKVDARSFCELCDQGQLQVVRSMQPWLVRWWRGWLKTPAFDATWAFIDRYVDSAAQDAEKPGSGPIQRTPALLDELIREAGSEDRVYLRNQIMNVFMPGRDSVAIMTSHVFFHLARHPAVYERVRREVLTASDAERSSGSYETAKNLVYTHAVVNESLRLGGPPNGQTVRDVLSDLILPCGGGVDRDQPIFVPKGSIVYVQIQALHRDRSAWGPDPHEFRPERWLERSGSSQKLAFEYLPFGGGRHVCPANALAVGEMAHILAFVALRFREIRNLDPEQELYEQGAIVMKIRSGVQVQLMK